MEIVEKENYCMQLERDRCFWLMAKKFGRRNEGNQDEWVGKAEETDLITYGTE
jgi:hypothetical protein